MAKTTDNREFERFSVVFRVQHIVLFLSTITLIITGLPLKFHDTRWAEAFFRAVGGVGASGLIHRAGAVALIAVGTFHMFYIIFTSEGRGHLVELCPRVKDVTDVIKNVFYFFGFSKEGPKFGRFSYIEKFDYWAVYWGMVIMIGTGLMLWFADFTLSKLPKFVLDAALEAHSDEALLATLAIVVWHFYNVHFSPDHFPGNLTWWHGKLSADKMKHHHPLEYEKLEADGLAISQSSVVSGPSSVKATESHPHPNPLPPAGEGINGGQASRPADEGIEKAADEEADK